MKPTTFAVPKLLFCSLMVSTLPACSQSRLAEQGQPAPAATAPSTDRNFARWEKEIAAYEAMDRAEPPAKRGVLFIGSSTIRRWKTLATDFPDQPVINRGFGGSQIEDATHFAERIIFPYEPRMILLRSGGNDLHAGKSPEQVFADYKAFVAKVHARLPKARIAFISFCPVPSRWAERVATQALNTLVEKYTRQHRYLGYIETYEMSLAPDGRPRRDLFVADQLHFNAAGYKILADRVRPFLSK